jgi:hypothetical protein
LFFSKIACEKGNIPETFLKQFRKNFAKCENSGFSINPVFVMSRKGIFSCNDKLQISVFAGQPS